MALPEEHDELTLLCRNVDAWMHLQSESTIHLMAETQRMHLDLVATLDAEAESLTPARQPAVTRSPPITPPMLGSPPERKAAATAAVSAAAAPFSSIETVLAAQTELFAYFSDLVAKRKADPKDDLVTLFAFADYFPAVATTDVLMRVADVLCCKPSELAFYPVPKLMIRRVGDHEAYSALRASELGDGTLEVRELHRALKQLGLEASSDETIAIMHKCELQRGWLARTSPRRLCGSRRDHPRISP